jgi:hypothetical protein
MQDYISSTFFFLLRLVLLLFCPSGMGVGAIVAFFIISYVLSGNEVTLKYSALGVGEGGSKIIGAGLIMFYFTMLVAIVIMVYSEINKALK